MDFNPVLLLQTLSSDLAVGKCDELSIYRKNILSETLLKKFVPNKSAQASLEKAAIEDFLSRNQDLHKDLDIPEQLLPVFATWRDLVFDFFMAGPFQTSLITLDSCLNKGYAGPGASRGTKFSDFVTKMFNSNLSATTPALHRHYVANISPRWYNAELIRNTHHSLKLFSGSALSAVPKDAKRCRIICTEPSINMFYQLGAKEIIELRLKDLYHIDMSTQPNINKSMAKSGSIYGHLSTIDLKNASDSISNALCSYLIPREVLSVFNILRSSYATYNGKEYKLNMISTMGNGFTFPLMTMLLTTLFKALSIHKSGSQYNGVNFACFGDDIIVPTAWYEDYVQLLLAAGFIVNSDKSFSTGFFRESCGGDYYKGHDVRGVYIRRFENEADCYSAFNRLFRWSCKHSINLNRTLEYLKGLVDFRPVPLHESDDSGFKCPSAIAEPRTNSNGSMYYRALKVKPVKFRVRDVYVNYDGALIGFLGGYIRDNTITVRPKARRYRVEDLITPNWDYQIDPEFNTRDAVLTWTILLS